MAYSSEQIVCPYCRGRGYMYVERGSSLNYKCTDCNGSGILEVCDECGKTFSGEYCEDCYAECPECREVKLLEEFDENGICKDCNGEN